MTDAKTKDLETTDSEETPEVHEVEQDFVYLEKVGRPINTGQIFLDDVMQIQAEKIRAKLEGREPDLENPGAIAGTPLVPLATAAAHNTKDTALYTDQTLTVHVGDENAVKSVEEQNKLADERPETAVTPNELATVEADKAESEGDAGKTDQAPAAKTASSGTTRTVKK